MVGFHTQDIVVMLILMVGAWGVDTLICSTKKEVITLYEAIMRSVGFVVIALTFGMYLYMTHGGNVASLYLSGYVMEKVLSIDNLIVFAAVFSYFRVASKDQPKILQYGIAGAVVFRLIFIVVGVGSLYLFGSVTEFIFGVIVAWSAWGLYKSDEKEEIDYGEMWFVRLAKKISVTPSFICLVAIEITDVMFAFDSVPVVIAITQDPLLIFSAMMFAILGLRAMYFVLAALREYLLYLDKAVIIVLVFIAVKLISHAVVGFNVSPVISCAIVLSIIGVGIVSSLMFPEIKHENNSD